MEMQLVDSSRDDRLMRTIIIPYLICMFVYYFFFIFGHLAAYRPATSSNGGKTEIMSRRKESKERFPTSLEEFGYRFNENGQLRQIDDPEEGFVFDVKPGNRAYNQKCYETLGEVITEEIYKLLESKAGLKRIFIPVDAKDHEPQGFFYMSDGALKKKRLMVLIHGSGVVRAGQWSRKLIINHDIDAGSQLPYIMDALQSGYGVVVLNTNLNRVLRSDGQEADIRGSEDPLEHALYVWDNFINGASSRYIAIVAHSAGGYVTANLAHERNLEFASKVFAIAFTDSVHAIKAISPAWPHLLKVSRNWVTSNLELGLPVRRVNDVDCVSAGTLSHEMTSAAAFSDIRRFIKQRYEDTVAERKAESGDVVAKEKNDDAMEVDLNMEPALKQETSTVEETSSGASADVVNLDDVPDAKDDSQEVKHEMEHRDDKEIPEKRVSNAAEGKEDAQKTEL